MVHRNRVKALLLLPAAACVFFAGWVASLANSKTANKIRPKAKTNNIEGLQFGIVALEKHPAN